MNDRLTPASAGSAAGTTAPPNGSSSPIRSVLRAIDLLSHWDNEHPVWTVGELTRATSLPKTTVIRLLATLQQSGMLWARPDGRITYGPKLLRWASLAGNTWEVPEPVRQMMRDLARTCGETVDLYIRDADARVCIAEEQGSASLRQIVQIGVRLPLWATAASKILLTDAPDALFDTVAAQSPNAAITAEVLRNHARAAVRDGMATSHGEGESGLSAVAVSITGQHNRCVGALSVSGPTPRFEDDHISEILISLKSTAQLLSECGFAEAFLPLQAADKR